jgi:hypothetical protein
MPVDRRVFLISAAAGAEQAFGLDDLAKLTA